MEINSELKILPAHILGAVLLAVHKWSLYNPIIRCLCSRGVWFSLFQRKNWTLDQWLSKIRKIGFDTDPWFSQK
jgi:hypothetical protein